jgi:hypothetical protein
VQVDPIKPKLTLPGTKRSKLNCDEPLSNFAFKFELRRYAEVVRLDQLRRACTHLGLSQPSDAELQAMDSYSGHQEDFEVVRRSMAAGGAGRGLHSSTFQLNLSRF